MKRTIRLHISLIILALIWGTSCERIDLSFERYNPKKYLPLSVGNYWVYETYTSSYDGLKIPLGLDSIAVKMDTIIQGESYYYLEGTWLGHRVYKQFFTFSSDKVVSLDGKIWFQGTKLGSIVDNYAAVSWTDTTYYEEFFMSKTGEMVDVPAGSFESIALIGLYSTPSSSEQVNVRAEWHYAKNIGMVKIKSNYILDQYILEMDLVRYHLE